MATVATYNAPHRLDRSGVKRKRDLQALARKGVTVVAMQELTDADPKRICPAGWSYHRPRIADSAAVFWKTSEWSVRRKGAYRISRLGHPLRPRYIVWVHLVNKRTKRQLRFGSCHLPAFKTSRPKNRQEFIYQEKRAAAWLAGGTFRCLAGDFNAGPQGGWLPNMKRVGTVSQPLRATGPEPGQHIDHVWRPKGQKTPRAVSTYAGCSDHKALIVEA